MAGITLGQDLSERLLQLQGTPPQFSLVKSFPGFGPVGPVVVTPDELADRDDPGFDSVLLEPSCRDVDPLRSGRRGT